MIELSLLPIKLRTRLLLSIIEGDANGDGLKARIELGDASVT